MGRELKNQKFQRYFMAPIEIVDATVIESRDEYHLVVYVHGEYHLVNFALDNVMRSKERLADYTPTVPAVTWGQKQMNMPNQEVAILINAGFTAREDCAGNPFLFHPAGITVCGMEPVWLLRKKLEVAKLYNNMQIR